MTAQGPEPIPIQNGLLSQLTGSTQERLLPSLRSFSVNQGEMLFKTKEERSRAYFPTEGIVSLVYVMQDGHSAEIAIVGSESVIGTSVVMGGTLSANRGVAQTPVTGLWLPGAQLQHEFDRNRELRVMLLRHTQALMTQMGQTAACNRHHSIQQQLCRRLLLSLDRLQDCELRMTHEFIANLLGVRREGITEAASRLQRSGIIEYSRGHIRVIDRDRLERSACECYSILKQETDRLQAPPTGP